MVQNIEWMWNMGQIQFQAFNMSSLVGKDPISMVCKFFCKFSRFVGFVAHNLQKWAKFAALEIVFHPRPLIFGTKGKN